MQRVTITLDDELMKELDAFIAARGYQNRSEAIRDLARAGIREAAEHRSKARLRGGTGLHLRPRGATTVQAADIRLSRAPRTVARLTARASRP